MAEPKTMFDTVPPPFVVTFAPLTKLVPVIVIVALIKCVTVAGLTLLMVGAEMTLNALLVAPARFVPLAVSV